MDDVYNTVLNLGLATGIAVYLIRWVTIKLNGKLDELNNSIKELKQSIDKLREDIMYRRGGGE